MSLWPRLLALLLFVASLAVASPVQAGCDWVETQQMVGGVIRIKLVQVCNETSEPGSTAAVGEIPARDSDWDAVCVRTALGIGADPARYCDTPAEPGQLPVLTPGLVAHALRTIELPASRLVVQLPNGRTLVNFKTSS